MRLILRSGAPTAIAYQLPGHGLSSPHSRDQITDLCIRRSLDSQAEPLTDAAYQILKDQTGQDYFGISHGGLVALKMAQQAPADNVKTVFGLDLPAVKRISSLGLQLGYGLDTLVARRRYLKALVASERQADYQRFQAAFAGYNVKPAASFIKQNLGLFALNLLLSVDARPVALETWQKLLQTKPTANVAVVTAEKSRVSDPVAIGRFICSLEPDLISRSEQHIVEAEDHNIGITQLIPRAVAWAEQAYTRP